MGNGELPKEVTLGEAPKKNKRRKQSSRRAWPQVTQPAGSSKFAGEESEKKKLGGSEGPTDSVTQGSKKMRRKMSGVK